MMHRLLLLFALHLILILLPTILKAQVTAEVRFGFGNTAPNSSRYLDRAWTPVTVYLGGKGIRGVGTLILTTTQQGNSVSYVRKVTMQEGPLNQTHNFTINLQNPVDYNFGGMPDQSYRIQLIIDGRELLKKNLYLPSGISNETYNVLAITRDGGGMSYLLRKKMGLTHQGMNPVSLINTNSVNRNQTVSANLTKEELAQNMASIELFYTDQRALPGQAQGYDAIDAIVLSDLPLDTLTDEQVQAIRHYVQQGGLLVLAGGADLSRLKSAFYLEMLPIQPKSSTNASASSPELSALATRYQSPLSLSQPLSLTTGTLKPNATSVIKGTTTGYGLIAKWSVGFGTVVFVGYDFMDEEMRKWKGNPSLWRDIFNSNPRYTSVRPLIINSTNVSRYNNSSLSLADALAGVGASTTPPFLLIAGFIGLYILLLIPMSYYILKKIDRRELAWFTSPLIILAFTAVAYFLAAMTKGNQLSAHHVVVLDAKANSDKFVGIAATSIYSPQRKNYDIAFIDGKDKKPYSGLLPSPAFTTIENTANSLLIDQEQSAIIRNAEVRLWDRRSFMSPVSPSLGGMIEAKTQIVGNDKVKVTVSNKTSFTIFDTALRTMGDTKEIGEFKPGETREITVTIPRNRILDSTSHYFPVPNDTWKLSQSQSKQKLSQEQIRNNIRYGLLQSFRSNLSDEVNYYNNFNQTTMQTFGKIGIALIGWVDSIKQPLVEIHLNNNKAQGVEAVLLNVHIPLPSGYKVREINPSYPFSQEPLLNIETEQNSGASLATPPIQRRPRRP